ncbi:MAG: PaaI family thioesterase [Chloroflexota bacterium]
MSNPSSAYYQPQTEVGEGTAVVTITIRPEFLHAGGVVHGSVYFFVMDDAATFAANSLITEGNFFMTSAFNMHFVRPTNAGIIRATAKVVNKSRRRMLVDVAAEDENSRLLARGTGTFMGGRSDHNKR